MTKIIKLRKISSTILFIYLLKKNGKNNLAMLDAQVPGPIWPTELLFFTNGSSTSVNNLSVWESSPSWESSIS